VVKVVAFRDVHRAEQLEGVARDFSTAWVSALYSGLTPHTLDKLEQLIDPDAVVKSAHPMGCTRHKGLDAVRTKLQRDHQALSKAGVKEQQAGDVKVVLVGSNDASDTAYCLLQLPAMGKDADPNMLLLKMDIMNDDSTRRVTSVDERGHLAGGFAELGKAMSSDEMHKKQDGCLPHFPSELIKPWANTDANQGDVMQKVQQRLEAWARARASCCNEDERLQQAGCTSDFKLLDAFGMLPFQTPVQGGGQLSDTNHCELGLKQVAEVFKAVKDKYDVEVTLVDSAVCMKEAAAFTHWKATHHNKKDNTTWDVEGMEVNIMDPSTGGLKAVYLFRDALDSDEMQKFTKQA